MEERINKIVDYQGKFVCVQVHEVYVAALTCRYQFTQEELLQLKRVVDEELEAEA